MRMPCDGADVNELAEGETEADHAVRALLRPVELSRVNAEVGEMANPAAAAAECGGGGGGGGEGPKTFGCKKSSDAE